jgi:hypothetical protein
LALPPPSNDVFLREVDDELRRDQLLAFWRHWGKWLIGGIVAALAAFAAFLGWQHHRETVAGEQGEQLTQAYDLLGNQQLAQADAKLATLAASNRDGYRAMAMFSQADVLLQQKKGAAAAAKFAAIAGDGSLAAPFRNLALIRQTAAEYDRLKPAVIVERLRPLAVVGGPWLGSAGEMLAGAYLREGRRDLAATLFGQIAQGDDVPASLRQRAVQMAAVLNAQDAAPAAAPTGNMKAK